MAVADGSKELAQLITKRSSAKGQLTKFNNYVTGIANIQQINPSDIAVLALRLSKIEELFCRYEQLQSDIEVLTPDNLDVELEERETMQQSFTSSIVWAQSIINKHAKQDEGSPESDSHMSTAQQLQGPVEEGYRLPQINISKFDGSYLRWIEFRDTFSSLIHNSGRIKAVHKFHYLISYLTGEAAGVISNLEISSDNYTVAWELLCQRYNNKRQLINHHLNSLLNISKATHTSNGFLRQMVDHITKNLRALSSLGQPTDKWDVLVIHIMVSKLDDLTFNKWEEHRGILVDVPDLSTFYKFLIGRADIIQSAEQNSSNPPRPRGNNIRNTKSFVSVDSHTFSCVVCQGHGHRIYDCPVFLAKDVEGRIAEVHKLKLCSNCLRTGHRVNTCRLGPCLKCKGRHNSLLHKRYNSEPDTPTTSNAALSEVNETLEVVTNFANQGTPHVLLSTAYIEVSNPRTNQSEKVRALLDCGSQSSFITKSLKQRLSLPTNSNNLVNIIGIGNSQANQATESCVAQLKSLVSKFNVTSGFLVLPQVTGQIPKITIDTSCLKLPKDLKLADPMFHKPAPTEVLIGADLFWDILGRDQYSLGPNNPKLRSSHFGWIISGPINQFNDFMQGQAKHIQCNISITNQASDDNYFKLHQEFSKFWELEELPNQISTLSESEKACEANFISNSVRLGSGRFSVGLPLKDSPDCLGNSYNMAKKRLLNLERRFKKQPEVKSQYVKFIREYKSLGHLSKSNINIPNPSYFLCHHAVFKEASESTKIRVVFDGSSPSSSGYSINDLLMVGPNIQDSLFSILVRARQYKYLLTGDIEKMYRQVNIHEEDRTLQLILWREHEHQPIQTLVLNTITYGMASSSYLSTRCLWQLGEECSDVQIKEIIQHDFYIDDVITGANSETELRHFHRSVTHALQLGCFNLRKFKTNLPSILDSSSNSKDNLIISESTSTLGIGWNPSTDCLHFPFKIAIPSDNTFLTKRQMLSNIFKIFDPLGLLSPSVTQAKLLLQQLWLNKLSRDEPIPHEMQGHWNKFAKGMPSLLDLQIPRRVLCDDPTYVELHSFSDASKNAYGACIYLRSVNVKNEVTVKLLCAKSKVAPLKATTIPRLELCAALLSAKLCKAVRQSLKYNISAEVHWCDSSIVLAWLRTSFQNLKVFVANRITEISELTDSSSWRHVPTAMNPADLISRGVNPAQLRSAALWWSGPSFLSELESDWPILNAKPDLLLPELKVSSIAVHVTAVKEDLIKFDKYSNFNKLKRIFAHILRFTHNIKGNDGRFSGPLTADEVLASFIFLCRFAQLESFKTEYDLLSKGKPLSPKSNLISLSPFIGNDLLIRVGGRLEASNYNYDKKHPILLSSNHHFTKIIFEYEHVRNLHAGPQLLLATIRETIWPLNGRHLARRTFRNCVKCRRLVAKTMQPIMGNMPRQRLVPGFPFETLGLDFAGPFLILNRKGRGSRLIKCYLCLFICLRYKCVHLEAVSDLSRDAFILTLHRFVSRRGKPSEIFGDNGRNFVSAAKEINKFIKVHANSLTEFASQEGIKFNFSPPYAPHFGGIFEAGIKSAKYHVKRVMGNSHLTFEEISTLFTQVEAVLNSRPLCPLSSSPDDFLCLTPGNFLIGRALNALPTPHVEDCNENHLQRYARLQQIHQHFWRRWQREYIAELQQRRKWKTNNSSPSVGDLVLIQEDDAPPLCWRLGRISKLYCGPDDGIAGVADVMTTRGCTRRPLVRLCALPTAQELQH